MKFEKFQVSVIFFGGFPTKKDAKTFFLKKKYFIFLLSRGVWEHWKKPIFLYSLYVVNVVMNWITIFKISFYDCMVLNSKNYFTWRDRKKSSKNVFFIKNVGFGNTLFSKFLNPSGDKKIFVKNCFKQIFLK